MWKTLGRFKFGQKKSIHVHLGQQKPINFHAHQNLIINLVIRYQMKATHHISRSPKFNNQVIKILMFIVVSVRVCI